MQVIIIVSETVFTRILTSIVGKMGKRIVELRQEIGALKQEAEANDSMLKALDSSNDAVLSLIRYKLLTKVSRKEIVQDLDFLLGENV